MNCIESCFNDLCPQTDVSHDIEVSEEYSCCLENKSLIWAINTLALIIIVSTFSLTVNLILIPLLVIGLVILTKGNCCECTKDAEKISRVFHRHTNYHRPTNARILRSPIHQVHTRYPDSTNLSNVFHRRTNAQIPRSLIHPTDPTGTNYSDLRREQRKPVVINRRISTNPRRQCPYLSRNNISPVRLQNPHINPDGRC